MKTINLTQGTPEWHAHRAKHYNASDAPAMMGCSPYETRSAIVARLATGIAPEVSEHQQRIFDAGHAFEKIGRDRAELIVNDELFSDTGVSDCGKYSASFDGLTMCGAIAFEHKTLNKELAAYRNHSSGCAEKAGLPERYLVQMEHQLMVSGAEKCLFGATNDQETDGLWLWYYSNAERRAAIIAGWEQLAKDVAAYVPPVTAQPVVAEAVEVLPTLWARTNGAVTVEHNMAAFKVRLDAYLADIKTTLVTDQDFADAKANAKACGDIESKLNLSADQLIAQNASVAEVVDFARGAAEQVRQMRLRLDKLVASEQAARKNELLQAATLAYDKHLAAIEKELEAICGKPMTVRPQAPDWRGAAANKRNLASMQDALDTALAHGKIALDAAAKVARTNLAHLTSAAPDHGFLFADLQHLVSKPADDFSNTVAQRMAQHADEIARKAQAEVDRREAQAKQDAERAARQTQAAPAPLAVSHGVLTQAPVPPAVKEPKTDTLCELRFEQWLNTHNKVTSDALWECWGAAWNAAGLVT